MALGLRHAVAALVGTFILATVAGAAGVFGGGDSGPSGTTIQFRPDAEEASATAKKKPAAKKTFTTEASKGEAGRIVLSGQAQGVKPGTRITVQRKQGSAWTDFPAGTTVDKDGSYELWIMTQRSGQFRMKDEGSGATSEPVTVTV
ncbi:MAG: hypothetical protein ACT4QG_21685 [Sporichthyaceae bacterium]